MVFRFFEKHPVISWIFVLALAGVIFYLSSLTFAPGPIVVSYESYVYHILIFFALSLFLHLALIQGERKSFLIIALAIALVYALLDEFHQLFVLGRSASFSDFALDSLGIFLASLLYLSGSNHLNRKPYPVQFKEKLTDYIIENPEQEENEINDEFLEQEDYKDYWY